MAELKIENWSPSLVMVTSPYEWKIFKLDVKAQANKQSIKHMKVEGSNNFLFDFKDKFACQVINEIKICYWNNAELKFQ